jgi:hypothetical protein
LRVITVDNADVIAIRKINPMAMPRIRFRMVGRSIDAWSGRTVMIRKRDEATKAKARPIWPGLLFSARRQNKHDPARQN